VHAEGLGLGGAVLVAEMDDDPVERRLEGHLDVGLRP
jgi:hypothetical protein